MVALAGCVGDGALDAETEPEDPVDPSPTPPSSIAWELRDCKFWYATTNADAVAVAQHIPDGYQLPAGNTVSVAYEYNQCETGTSLNGTEADMVYASIWTAVQPPNATAGVFSVVAFDVLIPDEDRREWLQGLGAPAHAGGMVEIRMGNIEQYPNRFAYGIGDIGRFALEYGAPQDAPNAGGTFDQWTQELATYWKTNWQTTSHYTAVGTVTIPEGSKYADWYPGTTVPAQFNLGTWDYTDGLIAALTDAR